MDWAQFLFWPTLAFIVGLAIGMIIGAKWGL